MKNHKNHAGIVPALAALLMLAGCDLSHPMFGFGGKDAPAPSGPAFELRTLSNRPDLISGDDALMEVVLPAGADASQVKVSVGGKDVTAAFALRADGSEVAHWGLIDVLPVSWQGPSLDPSNPSVATEVLEITHHGFTD